MPAGIRPTQNITRKAIFDILGPELEDVKFLELFAGSGAVGLEAASRGVSNVTLVEKNPKCCEVIEENREILGLPRAHGGEKGIELIAGDAFASIKLLAKQKRSFQVVFFDPPYGRELAKKALKTVVAYDILQPNCIVLVEHSKRESPLLENERLFPLRQRKYGKSYLAVYEFR